MEQATENAIGRRLRAARERAGLSREALAFHSGLSWSAIAQVESGRRTNLRPATLSALATALGVTIDYLVSGGNGGPSMLEHEALLYSSQHELMSSCAAFLALAAARSEPALVVTSQPAINSLRSHLGEGAQRVEFADHIGWYRSPADALEGYRDFVDRSVSSGAHWVRVIGEPVWSESQPEVTCCTRYESLLNLVFASSPMSVLCLYDAERLAGPILENAHATHPHIAEGASRQASSRYVDPWSFVLSG